MTPKECFDVLIARVEAAEMPPSFKSELKRRLMFFIEQSLLPLEARETPVELKNRWLEFGRITSGLKLFAIEQQNENLWRVVKCFVYEEEPTSLLVPKVDPSKKPKPVSMFARYTPEDFFAHLGRELEDRKQLTPNEYTYALMGLRYLESEAGKVKHKRNMARVKSVWSDIEPLLKRIGLLNQFKEEHELRTHVQFFIERTF